MLERALLLVLLVAAPALGQTTQPSPPAMPDSVRGYLREAMAIFQRNSVHRDSVDWPALEDSVVARAAGARTTADTWRALTWALRRVDRHSFLMPPAAQMTRGSAPQTAPPAARTAPRMSEQPGELLSGRIAVVRVAGHAGPNRASYVDSLHARIVAFDSAGACGWIVDLRDNTGGNMWPMLAGIGPLLGAEVVGSFTSGSPGARWRYRDGRSWIGDSTPPPMAAGWGSAVPRPLTDPEAPVALLTGRRTASSGEMTLMAFLGRPSLRTFGDSTAGFNSANVTVPLRDGATMVITASYPRDRLGRAHPLRVGPDELIQDDRADGDRALERAAAWLRGQPACSGS